MEARSPALERMNNGEAPQTPEEWRELALLLGSMAKFLYVTSRELDAIEMSLDVIEKIAEILADAQEPHVQALMKEVVVRAYEGERFPMPEVQEDYNGSRPEGPVEPDDGGFMSP